MSSPSLPLLVQKRRTAVAQAAASWASAPVSFRVMGSQFVGPLLDAMNAISVELDARDAARAQVETNRDGRAL